VHQTVAEMSITVRSYQAFCTLWRPYGLEAAVDSTTTRASFDEISRKHTQHSVCSLSPCQTDRSGNTNTAQCTNSLSLLMHRNHADRLGESDETRRSPRWPSEKAFRDGRNKPS